MPTRATALLVAIILFAVSGCAVLAIEYAPLPESWDAFMLSILVLVVLVWLPLILAVSILLLLAISAVARHLASPS